MANILVTGCAGFIGYHLASRLIARSKQTGDQVAGLDNLNDYYDVDLKKARLAQLTASDGFQFHQLDLADRGRLARLFGQNRFGKVVNLAAQVGVRYSVTHPEAYVDSNLAGFANLLEGCRQSGVEHLVFASSSSVYGESTRMPFSAHDSTDHPVSLYAATKRANELMAHAYAHLYRLPVTGLRFFTVYGPWGRPDMAYFLFTQAILEGRPISAYNHGKMMRDFTYVDDAVEAVVRLMDRIPAPDPAWSSRQPDAASSSAPYRIYNVGNHRPVELTEFIRVLEQKLGKKARLKLLPMQPGDVPATYADVDDLSRDIGFTPETSIEEGLGRFVDWYRKYYGV